MALESVTAAETLIQSNATNDDLEDGEIPSDEDDEPIPPVPAATSASKSIGESIQKSDRKSESPKHKSFDSKFGRSKKSSGNGSNSGKQERFAKYKNPSEDFAGDVEKAIRAVLEEQDRSKGQDNTKSKSKSNRSKNRKRARDEKDEERAKEQKVRDSKKRKLSDEENGHEDDDEMLFVRGASPVSRREGHDTTRSPPRRSTDRDNYDNLSDNDDRPSDRRQRDNDSNKRAAGSGGGGGGSRGGSGRRGGKSERGGKNKGRAQLRNERNGRRNQNPEHSQDPDSICLYYMQGKCHRGDDCPFSHNALPPRKMELCKFYLMDCCAKRDKCLYMHHDFPCKFYHTGLKCVNAENCKFSHQPLNEQVKNILLKHLETAPKEILGDFPRLSREGALLMINNTARNLSQGQETGNQKIPSLFDVALPAPNNSIDHVDDESRGNGTSTNNDGTLQQKRPASSGGKERKPAGKKTRWGSDEDRVPYEQIMLLQSVSQLGLHLPNVALGLAVQQQVQQQLQQHILIQQCLANMEFYNEIHGSPPQTTAIKEKEKEKEKEKDKEDFTKDVEEDEILAQSKTPDDESPDGLSSKDVDLRQILNANRASVNLSVTDDAASLTTAKFDDESDRDEETSLVIEMPLDEEEKEKDEDKSKNTENYSTIDNDKAKVEKAQTQEADDLVASSSKSPNEVSSSGQSKNSDDQDLPPRNMPKKAQELFMRIQQQQRAAKDSLAIADDQGEVEDATKNRENWYSDDEDDGENEEEDDDDDDDDDEGGNLQIVIKDSQKDESDRGEDGGDGETPESLEPSPIPETPSIPQPAVFVDKLGDLSKIDISAEVTKLLSAIKPQSTKSSRAAAADVTQSSLESRNDEYRESKNSSSVNRELSTNSPFNSPRHSDDRNASTKSLRDTKAESGNSSPRSSSSVAPVSRDPRMSRDPRQRRADEQKLGSPSHVDSKKESRTLRLETSIYSSGIMAMDTGMDTDLRGRLDQDHRRKDMDLRQRYPQQDFGDTDLRVVGSSAYTDASSSRSDVDLRQMLTLPFKPAPSHVPCTEIDASTSSHPPITYKVYVVDIPRPDYSGLKLTKNDAQVRYDPRLRKIFRLPKVDIADSPMSPPPAAQTSGKLEMSSKSPPHSTIRTDPRRKALEGSQSTGVGLPIVPGGNIMQSQGPGVMGPQQHQQVPQSIQQPDGMGAMGMGMQAPPGMGGMPPQMGQNPMMANMGPMGPMMVGQMNPQNMPPMGMGPPGMGPPGMGAGNGASMGPNQMAYDPRYAAQRNGGPGLLGPAPGMGYGPDVGPGYDGQSGYPGPGNFSNYGPGPGPTDPNIMGFGPNGPNPGSFGGNVPPAEWTTGNQNQMRRGGRVRRRNRNRTNTGPNNRGNRSPP